MTKRRDKTPEIVKKANVYLIESKSKDDKKRARQSSYEIYHHLIRQDLGLEEIKCFIDGNKVKIWQFSPDCEYSKGELSASRIASLLIKYRRALKAIGAIHKRFIPTLEEAKKILLKAGVDEKLVAGLKSDLKLKNLEDRITNLKRAYPKGSPTGKVSIIRKALDNIKIYHPMYYRLAGAVSFVKSITNSQQKLKLKEKHDKKIKVNHKFLLNKAQSILNNPDSNWIQLTVALCAVTGRRPTEIMKTAKFKLSDNTPQDYVTFNGILKSRDRKFEHDFGDWNIPVFYDPHKIIKVLRKLRTELKKKEKLANDAGGTSNYWTGGYLRYINQEGKSIVASIFDPKYANDVDHNTAINQQYNGLLNNELRKWFESGDIEIKSLRAIYTKMVWEREKDTSPETYESMTTRILCYAKESISEAVKHYAAIELSDKTEKITTIEGEKNYTPSEKTLKILENADKIIEKRAVRAPSLARVHGWAKHKASLGISLDELTATYIRRHCRVEGKSINANTATLYIKLVNEL